jgi:single-strand DNA-binding protein
VQYTAIVAWRGLAEIAAQFLNTGRLVYVAGRLKGQSWTAQDGTPRWVLEVFADDIQFLSAKHAGPSPIAAAA